MNEPDAVVVGAGPAGSAAAWSLAKRGARVTLVDRAQFPRVKVCGGCLAPGGLAVLERIGVGPRIPSLEDAPRIHALELRSGDAGVRLSIPGYRVIDRARFDNELVRAAVRQGVSFIPGALARVGPDSGVYVERDRERIVLRPRIVVVCDGIKGSSLGRDSRFAWRVRARSRVGLGVIAQRLPASLRCDAVTMLHAREGYLGVAPLGDGRAILAAAADPGSIRSHARGGAMLSILDRFGLDPRCFGALGRPTGAPALTRRRTRVEADGRVFLIGDATGYIEPFTGEGVSWALGHAERITPIALDAIAGRGDPGAWSRALRRLRPSRTRMCTLTACVLRSAPLTRASIRLCDSSRGLSGLVSAAVFRAHARHAAGVV